MVISGKHFEQCCLQNVISKKYGLLTYHWLSTSAFEARILYRHGISYTMTKPEYFLDVGRAAVTLDMLEVNFAEFCELFFFRARHSINVNTALGWRQVGNGDEFGTSGVLVKRL